MRYLAGYVLVAACATPGATVTPDGGSATPDAPEMEDFRVWPNSMSRANSDEWLVAHHDELRQIRPHVLVLNFNNATSNDAVKDFVENKMFPAFDVGSKFHGYADPAAPAFLDYQLYSVVDLRDAPGSTNVNGTKLPRKPQAGNQYRFDYGALFKPAFAQTMGIADPDDASRVMGMCELFERGFIHEVWINTGTEPGSLLTAEELDRAQVYDAAFKKVPGKFEPCSGNGCFDAVDVPSCKVTVKLSDLNMTRGPGCKLHATGHAIEGIGVRGTPYMVKNFSHFADLDFKTRLHATFGSWYEACGASGPCVTIKGPDKFAWRTTGGATGTFSPFAQGCGNIHYTANSRFNYDYDNTQEVLATCEHFGMHDGPDGKDLPTTISASTWLPLDPLAPDCGGGWQVYWRQNIPGLGNTATAADGKPMKNWWPFLFY
jgi:hypothetical protein